MQKPKLFQIVVTGIFIVLLVFGFLGFSGKIALPTAGGDVNYGNVTLWGTLPSAIMQTVITGGLKNNKSIVINYVQKNADTFNTDFVEALARGNGPDLILLPQDEIVKKLDKLSAMSYRSYPERDFKDTFIPEGEMFLFPVGVIALPFIIDPVVMYWNRDIFTSALIAAPPVLWSDFYSLVPKITVHDKSGNITRSLVSFGEYRNVSHAKEIVATLMMQAGSQIVANNKGVFSVSLDTVNVTSAENPIITAMRFFTEFSKPDKDSYSWNRSLPESHSMFEAGDLALYFGYASEYEQIKKRNPHLNFDVTMMPQVGSASTKLTFGRIQGVAITAASRNQIGAFYAATILAGKSVAANISAALELPPVRRDLISLAPGNAKLAVFYDSALISRGWYDPSPSESNLVFMAMFDSVTSGRNSMAEALAVANGSLSKIINSR